MLAVSAALMLAGCATVSIPPSNVVLNDDQVIDMMKRPDRWLGRTVTVRIYPYDNGYSESYVACFERCDAAYAANAIFIVYTGKDRFKGRMGNDAVTVKAVFRKICPNNMPMCMDNRIFALDEVI